VTWQWRKDGAVLDGETNHTLVRTNVTHLDLGPYSVLASNQFGAALSRARFVGECFYFDGSDGWNKPAPNYPTPAPSWKSVKYLNGRFIIVGEKPQNSPVYLDYSADGEMWRRLFLAIPLPSVADVEFGNGLFVFASGLSASNAPYLYVVPPDAEGKPDGTSVPAQSALPFAIRNLVFGNQRFVAIGTSNLTDGYVASSSNGVTWLISSLPAGFAINNVTFGNGCFVATASRSEYTLTNYTRFALFFVSTNGETWQQVIRTNATVEDVSFAGGRFHTSLRADISGQPPTRSLESSLNGTVWSVDAADPAVTVLVPA
jgi:hypothetical protein